jgi:hypothetical protein
MSVDDENEDWIMQQPTTINNSQKLSPTTFYIPQWIVFKGPVRRTGKNREPDWTELQSGLFSGCSSLDLLKTKNLLKPVITGLNWPFYVYNIHYLLVKIFITNYNFYLLNTILC